MFGRKKPEEEEAVDIGSVIMSWETWEYPPVSRDMRWYVIWGLLLAGMLVYAVITANFVFALLLLMFAVLTVLKDVRPPRRIETYVTTSGILFGHEFYAYEEIRDFFIAYEPPHVKSLYISFASRVRPALSIGIDGVNPNELRQNLLPYIFENLEQEGESLTDILQRVYKL